MKMQLFVGATLVLFSLKIASCAASFVYFQPGTEYQYSFSGVTAINHVKSFDVEAKIGIIPLGQEKNQSQHCELKVHHYFISTEAEGYVQQINTEGLDFSKWCSFHINQYGQIEKVFSSQDDEPFVLALKKTILGALSSRLIVSESQHKDGRRWGYSAQEIGHEGLHESTYQAEPNGDVIIFTKKKHTPPLKGAVHRYHKNVSLGIKTGVLEHAQVDESFATPKELPLGFGTVIPGAKDDLLKGDREMGMPSMGGNSTMKLVLDIIKGYDDYLRRLSVMPDNLKKSALQIEPIPESLISLQDASQWTYGNLTCSIEAKKHEIHDTSMRCFKDLLLIMKRLHLNDLIELTKHYKNSSNEKPLYWNMYLNALGAAKTDETLHMLLNVTLLAANATPEILMNAMVHFTGLKKCPTKATIYTFEAKVFHHPWKFPDCSETELVNERAELVLGSLVSAAKPCYPDWADDITRKIETMLGTHDPYNHRAKRSEMTQYEFKKYVNKKSLHILALGNGRIDSSLKYFESFLNTSESHLHLRTSAVEAISKYHHLQAAEMLLKAFITDEDDTVRCNARQAYEKHPHGGDLAEFSKDETLRYSNVTSVQHKRVKRSLMDILGRIWKGFHFHLKAPSYNWRKSIGGEMLGASMGVLIENYLDVVIKPLSGHGKVNVHDAAWATLHIGIFGMDIDIFRAELCYKGGIEYNLNILAEFGFDDAANFVVNFGKVVRNITSTIKTSIKQFTGLVTMSKDFDIGKIIHSFIDTIKNLPNKVLDFRKVGRKLLRIVDQFTDMPPVIDMIKQLVQTVTSLVNDIKTDIMTLYQRIVDTVTTTLPWAWEEIKESIKGIGETFKSILENPQKAIQAIGRYIARITMAVGVVLEAKNKIVEANIFAKDQRPYWFDVVSVFKDIKEQIQAITNEIRNIDTHLTVDRVENEEAKEFTGVDLETLIKTILAEIWQEIKNEIEDGPVAEILKFLSPFLETYESLTQVVENIKEAWRLIVNAYRTAKTLIELIFGFKLDKKFPNKYLLSPTCGDGFWKSTGKGRYKHPGVDINITSTKIVSPANGEITKTGTNQISLLLDEMDETVIIIENVKLNNGLHRTQVAGGQEIGTVVRPYWCSDKHIHFSMRRTGGGGYIDPSKYMQKRKMSPPVWKESCDFYVLRWLGATISQGSITKEAETNDTTQSVPNAPSAADINVGKVVSGSATNTGRKKRFLDQWVDNMKDFAESLGLPQIENLKDVFNFKMTDITMDNLMKFLDKYNLTNRKKKIESFINKIQDLKGQTSCHRPSSMTNDELKMTLESSGKSTAGARITLEKRYKESDKACYGIRNKLGLNTWCHFDSSCLSVSCCVEAKFFKMKYLLQGFITLDPCSQTITLGIDSWSKVMNLGTTDFAIENSEAIINNPNILDVAQLLVYYKIQKEGNMIKVSFGIKFCSSYIDKCMDMVTIMDGALLVLSDCKSTTSRSKRSHAVRQKRQTQDMSDMVSQSVGEFLSKCDLMGLDEQDVQELMQTLTEAFQEWLKKQIANVISGIFGNEFSSFDICLNPYSRDFGPYEVEIYSGTYIIPLGPIPCPFSFGISGFYGASFRCKLCLVSMKATATIVPKVGTAAWGAFGLHVGSRAFRFTAYVKLTGYILTSAFPTKVEVAFTKFPLDVKARMDLEMIPLRLELRVTLRLKIFSKTKTLIDAMLWDYQTKAIHANLLNINNAEPDETPPLFDIYPPPTTSVSPGGRKRRSMINGLPECTVYQIPNKDYTEPEFFLGVGVVDDKSEVEMTYCVGTFSGGCDVVKNESLGGNSVVQRRFLHSGIPLHVTVIAKNTQGSPATTSCQLPTYDVTLPQGRITPDFHSTSHPHILRASVFMVDDTPITNASIAVGYGMLQYGNQVVDWTTFEARSDTRSEPKTHIFGDLILLNYFSNPREGRLSWKPFSTHHYKEPEECAKHCLSHPGTKCLSINYDYGPGGTCELLEVVEGESTLHHSGHFYHLERLGIGQTATFDFSNLQLKHQTVVYFNLFLQNKLNYRQHLHSHGIIVDTTPPEPGHIENAALDVTSHEDCYSYTPSHLSQKCLKPTPLPNYRYIVDGPGSKTVYNGLTPLTDHLYTRSNTMVTGNWDGFADKETGLLIYTWSVGTEPCAYNIHPHKDPHAHIAYESEWTHVGIAYPLDLPDGYYHISVRALNNVEFGGPMAITVCHSTPFVIDTSDPIIVNVSQAVYDEIVYTISLDVYSYDDLSDIKRGEIGLGRTKRDTYIQIWTGIENHQDIVYPTKLPDGIPVWIKVRITNNVDLRSRGHSPRPIFIDDTAPIGGIIYHGSRSGVQFPYQSQTDILCVNWLGFHDPHSGIGAFLFGIGSSAGETDILDYVELPFDTHAFCAPGLNLQHNNIYYVTLVAEHGATMVKNVTVSSRGVLVDTTPPVPGWVKDGLPGESDPKYSSSSTTVTATWGNFSDRESGIDYTDLYAYRLPFGTKVQDMFYSEHKINAEVSKVEKHHFHLRHKDFIEVHVSAKNRAGLSTTNKSDGYTVDLTEPKQESLLDGFNVSSDKQYIATAVISATWLYTDEESGLLEYQFSVYSLIGGHKKKIYPDRNSHKSHQGLVLSPLTTTFSTPSNLSLTPGWFYYTKIAALNNADLTSVHDTDGIILDPSPPKMVYVNAGTVSGSAEEVIDGFVYHNDRSGLTGSWKATDLESGISEYFVGVGTTSGNDEVSNFKSYSSADNGWIIDLALNITDNTHQVPLYYINVYAINGAGQRSGIHSSSPIYIVEEDKEGTVWDGPHLSFEADIDSQLDDATVTVRFSGFESDLHGITHYEWAIGTIPRLDDVKPYSSQGIIVIDTNKFGLGNAGVAQLPILLKCGVKYFSTIRAITGIGNILDSSSDGFIVDDNPPLIQFVKIATEEEGDSRSVIYESYDGNLEAVWEVTDEMETLKAIVTVGTYPGADNIMNESTVVQNSIPNGIFKPTVPGIPNIIAVIEEDKVGLISEIISPPIVIDNTAPTAGVLECPAIVTEDVIICAWEYFKDEESGISKYLLGVGDTEGGTNVIPFQEIPPETDTFSFKSKHGLNLTHNKHYFVTLKAVNFVHMETVVYSLPIQVDNTPPSTGWIVELKDYVVWSSDTKERTPVKFGPGMDVTCQRDLNQLQVAWQPFVDKESDIEKYEIGIGSTPGGTQIHPFMLLAADISSHLFTNLDLSNTREAFVILKGYNKAGIYNSVISNGVFISRHSAGLTPLKPLHVRDGPDGYDIDFQNNRDTIAATWDFSGDPCPVVEYEWSIKRFDGKTILPLTKIPKGLQYANADELELYDRQSYFVLVKATNALGYTTILHSDGVTIKLEPLIPGIVRDGPISGIDLKFQSSITSISGNWDGFGNERDEGAFDEPAYEKAQILEIGEHQNIMYYEVAVGTDRRYANTRDNVHHFINVGLKKSLTFSNIHLSTEYSVYYITVRAHSVSTATVEVTSNGIRIINESGLISTGKVNIPRYINSENKISFEWDGFVFMAPVMRYYWTIHSEINNTSSFTCEDLLLHKGTFKRDWINSTYLVMDIKLLTDVSLDTYVTNNEMKLTHGSSYTLYVIAVDEAGICGMATTVFTVDVTAPITGNLVIGPRLELKVFYAQVADNLKVAWENYFDQESGIKLYKIALYRGRDCLVGSTEDKTLISEEFILPPETTDYSFVGLNIELNIPYYVLLQIENNAGLSIETTSHPILADFSPIISGKVVDGLNYQKDVAYFSERNSISGSILYTPPGNSELCPFKIFDLNMMASMWTKIVHKGMWLLPEGKEGTIIFLDSQISYPEPNIMTITLQRDITKEQMISGAVMGKADVYNGGDYEFEIKPSHDFAARTSIIFCEGQTGIFIDHGQELSERYMRKNDSYLHGFPDPLPGDTFPLDYSTDRTLGKGFGFQIIPGINGTDIILWSSDSERTRYVSDMLNIDLQLYHNFKLAINEDYDNPQIGDWNLKLYVDGEMMGELAGVSGVGRDSNIMIGVSRVNGDIPEISNKFLPPTTQTCIKIIRFPPPSDALCRHGLPFQASTHSIVEFHAAIGSEQYNDDIVNFQLVNRTCIPCVYKCDVIVCDKQCPTSVKLINFQVENVSLNPYVVTADINGTQLLKSFFLTVKGITGSGKEVISSSNGFYIDETPPVINVIHHIDPSWSSEEPIKYQGSNNTIAVYWEATEDYSEITEYQWSIGTSRSSTDIQNYTSTGTTPTGLNNTLLLKDHTTYYVTIRAYNSAGQFATKVSEGVTVLLTPPNIDGCEVISPNTEPIKKISRRKTFYHAVQTVITRQQDFVTCAWNIQQGKDIDSVYGSVGTQHKNSDIFSETQVGFNNSGILTISTSGVSINNESMGNISFFNSKPISGDSSIFMLERGRTMVCNLRACTKGHLCTYIPANNMVIVDNNDSIQSTDASGHISIVDNSDTHIKIYTANKQLPDTYIVYGVLNNNDLATEYAIAGSSSFVSFIANPVTTHMKVERDLYGTWKVFTDISFFLGSLPDMQITGPTEITVSLENVSQIYNNDYVPKVLTWCPEEALWVDASNSCDPSLYKYEIDQINHKITINICSIEIYCANLGTLHTRKRRQIGITGLSKTKTFVLGGFNTTTVNYPPYMTSSTEYHIYEDSGTVKVLLTAVDPENDPIEFILDNRVLPHGSVNISRNGLVSYKPCADCVGRDEVHFNLIERQSGKIPALSTSGILKFIITPVNDNPNLLVINQGQVMDTTSHVVNLTVNNNAVSQQPYKGLYILIGAYDVESDDLTLYFEPPKYGQFNIEKQHQTTEYIRTDCTQSWDNQSLVWEEELSKFEKMQNFSMPIPCNLNRNWATINVNWLLSAVKYVPMKDFIGMDTVKVYASDKWASPSYVHEMQIFVLSNPCWNNATCYKPGSDESCTDLQRSEGFEGYYCNCGLGYTGVYCETDINECASNPCKDDHVCNNEIGRYTCQCMEGKNCDRSPVHAWVIITVVVLLLLSIIVASLFIWCYCLKKGSLAKVGCYTKPSGHDRKHIYQLEERPDSARPFPKNVPKQPAPYHGAGNSRHVMSGNSSDVIESFKMWAHHPSSAPTSTNYNDFVVKTPSGQTKSKRYYNGQNTGYGRPVSAGSVSPHMNDQEDTVQRVPNSNDIHMPANNYKDELSETTCKFEDKFTKNENCAKTNIGGYAKAKLITHS